MSYEFCMSQSTLYYGWSLDNRFTGFFFFSYSDWFHWQVPYMYTLTVAMYSWHVLRRSNDGPMTWLPISFLELQVPTPLLFNHPDLSRRMMDHSLREDVLNNTSRAAKRREGRGLALAAVFFFFVFRFFPPANTDLNRLLKTYKKHMHYINGIRG